MSWKSSLIKHFAARAARKLDKLHTEAVVAQERIFEQLISKAKATKFGRDHQFEHIQNYQDFCDSIPIRDYEGLRPYVEAIIAGEKDVLWPGVPKYFAKTSGTTSGVKYIPITKDSTPNHIATARIALFNYAAQKGNADFFDGRLIFLSGSPTLTKKGNILTGRLSGIVNHHIPNWLKKSQVPSYETNCIEDWEDKLSKIIDETVDLDMRLISGIPPWVQMYYEQLLDRTGKKNIKEIFPNYQLFVYGGVNYEPYRAQLESLAGKIDSLETYPASEGFIAFQDRFPSEGLLLNADSGIFYEFIPLSEINRDNPTRLWLKDVQLGQNYVVIINSNAGLWGYNIGDTVEFVSIKPWRVKVTGRVKHFISAFGEHVIGKEVETAMQYACAKTATQVVEFTVAPQITPTEGLPYHEWLIEFDKLPDNMEAFTNYLDESVTEQNIYYKDLIEGAILRRLVVTPLQKNAFRNYMKTQGKLGGQNKVPRLSNDRKLADALEAFLLVS